MAQILKFAGGGSTPSSSWGTFTIDNVTYKMDDDNIQRLYDHAKTLDPDVAYQFDFIINALKSGKNLSYSNNKLYGGVDFETSDRQAKKIKEKPARGFGKGRDALLAISSLDNLSLANEINKRRKTPLKCFVQVNISAEPNKSGVDETKVIPFIKSLSKYENIEVVGLMAIAKLTFDEDLLNSYYQTMKELQEEVKELNRVDSIEKKVRPTGKYVIEWGAILA
jgi:hypothetical protein